MRLKKTIALAVLAAGLGATTPAWAGSYVHGYGETLMQALGNAKYNAEESARKANTCISTPPSPETCKQNSGIWDCYAIVANHRGSC